ncbi:hypothetical protein PIROE2DRAFT_6177 [Piromyces sp. E2]|nr:hypothetical protein PIROE2DRAFT_6177 [Piromyces sp. E2]|eukprot:OUM66556.1 hypothetical protein PIROE2DRAFT_6177 [Piromyces sp. E2]
MLNLKFEYLLLITLLVNSVFGYFMTDRKNTGKPYYIAVYKDNKTHYICSTVVTAVGLCNFDRCVDNQDLITDCYDQDGNYSKANYGTLSVSDPFSCPFLSLRWILNKCVREKVYVNDDACYLSSNPAATPQKINVNPVKGYYTAVAFRNNRALTEFGWCRYEKNKII